VAEEAQKALKATVSRTDPEKLAEQAGSLTMDQRRKYLGYLKKEYHNQPQKLSRIQNQEPAASSEGEDDPKIGIGASLQQLRKAVKAALKQSSDVEHDEF